MDRNTPTALLEFGNSRQLNLGEGVARTGCMRAACGKERGQYLWHLLISIAMKAIVVSSNFRPAARVPDE